MLKINRALATIAMTAALAGGAAIAAELPGLGGTGTGGSVELTVVKNGEDGYQIGYPSNWGIVTGGDSDYTFGPTDGSAKGFCFANGNSAPGLPGNDELLPIVSQPMGEQNWISFMFEGISGLKFVSTGVNVNHPGGWPVQTAVVEADIGEPVTIGAVVTLKSKSTYAIACLFARADFPKVEPTLSAIFDSFKVFKE